MPRRGPEPARPLAQPARPLFVDLAMLLGLGASLRATIAPTLGAKAWAFLRGRGHVTPQAEEAIAADVLRHRTAVTDEAEGEDIDSDRIVANILDQVVIP